MTDVSDIIDSQPIGRGQIVLAALCSAVLFMDGFDTQAIGYVAPALAKAWALPRGALGPVFSASLAGLMAGALTLGPLADRIGRKWIILASTAVFGLLSLATMAADSANTLLVLRFLTGLGLGGAMPNAIALTAEFSPLRRRASMVMLMFCGFSVGAAVGGLIAAWLLPLFGWRSVFLAGGAGPLLLLPLLAVRLPESVRFLAVSGGADARVARDLMAMFPSRAFPPDTRFTATDPKLTGLPVRHLFRDRRARVTLLLWTVFFMSLLDLYFLSNWLPTLVNDLGASVSMAALVASMLQVGGIVGTITLSRVIDRFSFRALALTYLMAAVMIAAIGLSGASIGMLTAAIFGAGFCVVGGQIAANGLCSTRYPTAIRATGVGWANGIGRIGSITGPLAGGVLLAAHWGPGPLFIAAALPALVACGAAVALSRRTR
jgi:AAHS family 4-hydroxybenzoate transporter-like MFS transporter